MNDSTDTKPFPCQLARISWVAGVIAIVLIAVTGRSSARVTGELIAFMFVGVGILASIVSLATIPKFGTQQILWPALAGIAVNGLLLAIAIPNFLHARQRAIEQQNPVEVQKQAGREPDRPPVAEQGKRSEKQPTNWRPYRIAGLEIMSPFELKKDDAVAAFERGQKDMHLNPEQLAAAREKTKRVEAYRGQKNDFALSLNGRALLPDEIMTTESVVNQITAAMRQKFPEGFQSKSREVMIDGNHATRLTIECQIQARTAKVENVIILGPSNLWQIQIFGPADFAQYDETAEKIFGSVRFLPAELKPTL